jgi:hypothetical protein
MGRDDCAGVGLYSSAARHMVCDDGAQILGDSDCYFRENPSIFWVFFRSIYGSIHNLMRSKRLSVHPCGHVRRRKEVDGVVALARAFDAAHELASAGLGVAHFSLQCLYRWFSRLS